MIPVRKQGHQPLQTQEFQEDGVELNATRTAIEMQVQPEEATNSGVGYCGDAKNPRKNMGALGCGCIVLSVVIVLIVSSARHRRMDGRHGDNSVKSGTGDSACIQDEVNDQWAQFRASSPGGSGIVATDNENCSDIGVNILRAGGNAFDAAAAVTLCLGVVSPASSGIGGGAMIVTYESANKKISYFDSRETAPGLAENDMFDDDPQASQFGGKAVATLGEIKGLHEMHYRMGALPFNKCTEPAAQLAEAYAVSAELASILRDSDVKPYLLSGEYQELSSLFLNDDGSIKREGEIVRNNNLAKTLRSIGEHGSDYIYKIMAETLAAEVKIAGGLLTKTDIEGYQAKESEPVKSTCMGYTLYSASGSSSGGLALAGICEFMNSFKAPLVSQGLLYSHRLLEAFKNVFAIRMGLADPFFGDIDISGPRDALLNVDGTMTKLNEATLDNGVLPLHEYGGEFNIDKYLPDDQGTTHFSIVDKFGNAVSMTSTINTYFGSKLVSPSTGIVYNNQMDDFSNRKKPNYFGLHPSLLNLPEPGKRPLSSMSPFILIGKNGVRLVGGASGGPRIITATASVLLNVIGRGWDLLQAVRAPRLHSQLLPDVVYVEDKVLEPNLYIKNSDGLSDSLTLRGHKTVKWSRSMGVAQFVEVHPDSGELIGVSDPRKGGKPASLT